MKKIEITLDECQTILNTLILLNHELLKSRSITDGTNELVEKSSKILEEKIKEYL